MGENLEKRLNKILLEEKIKVIRYANNYQKKIAPNGVNNYKERYRYIIHLSDGGKVIGDWSGTKVLTPTSKGSDDPFDDIDDESVSRPWGIYNQTLLDYLPHDAEPITPQEIAFIDANLYLVLGVHEDLRRPPISFISPRVWRTKQEK